MQINLSVTCHPLAIFIETIAQLFVKPLSVCAMLSVFRPLLALSIREEEKAGNVVFA
jgi:hypothetical protein